LTLPRKSKTYQHYGVEEHNLQPLVIETGADGESSLVQNRYLIQVEIGLINQFYQDLEGLSKQGFVCGDPFVQAFDSGLW
jgi:hypothetical protein